MKIYSILCSSAGSQITLSCWFGLVGWVFLILKGSLLEKLPSYGVLTPPHITTSLTSHINNITSHITCHSRVFTPPHLTISLTSHISRHTSLTSLTHLTSRIIHITHLSHLTHIVIWGGLCVKHHNFNKSAREHNCGAGQVLRRKLVAHLSRSTISHRGCRSEYAVGSGPICALLSRLTI